MSPRSATEELEERVREGDATVTADDIEQARRQEQFAGLQVEAAERAAAKEKETERLRRIDELRDELQARDTASPTLTELADEAGAALDVLLDALNEHNAFVGSTAKRMRALRVPALSTMNPTDPAALGVDPGGGAVAAGGVTWKSRSDVAAVALAILFEVLQARRLEMPANHPSAYGTAAQQLAHLVRRTR